MRMADAHSRPEAPDARASPDPAVAIIPVAEREQTPQRIVVGAGATGTALAAELHRTARDVLAYGFDRIARERDLLIVLVEAGDRVLPGLPECFGVVAVRQ